MKKKVLVNTVVSVLSQILMIGLGILLPRFFIMTYGSDVNGLLGTVGQIFTYVALLEAGISQATKNALYQPLANKNRKEVTELLSISNSYYHRVTLVYLGVVFVLAFVSPLVIKTEVSYWTICFIFLLEGASSAIVFWFLEKWRALIAVDGRQYVEEILNFVVRIATYAFKIMLCLQGWNFVYLSLIGLLLSLLRLLVYAIYMKKTYPWLQLTYIKKKDKQLEDRNAYVVSDIAWTVFASVDVIVLSVMYSTALTSVYSVYNMIYSNLAVLMNTFYSSIAFILGQMYFKNKKEYQKYHDSYETFFIALMTLLMSCCSVLANPFVSLYTNGVKDTNYLYVFLPLLMGAVQILSWGRYVSGNLLCFAGYVKTAMKSSLIETGINAVCTILWGYLWGIYGMLLATVVSVIYKVIVFTYMSNKTILKRSTKRTFLRILMNFVVYLVVSLWFVKFPINPCNIFELCIYAVITFFISMVLILGINTAIEPQLMKFMLQLLIKRNQVTIEKEN